MSKAFRGAPDRSRCGPAEALRGDEQRVRSCTMPGVAPEPANHRPTLDRQLELRIVVALDGSRRAERILRAISPLAQSANAVLILVRAVPSSNALARASATGAMSVIQPSRDYAHLADVECRRARAYLARVACRLHSQGLAVTYMVVVGSPDEALVRHARRVRAQFIAMTTRGRAGLSRTLMGSVAQGVLRRAHCPVLLIRSRNGVSHRDADAAG
jgi:nucleotide-binding universal stress UspA family protein